VYFEYVATRSATVTTQAQIKKKPFLQVSIVVNVIIKQIARQKHTLMATGFVASPLPLVCSAAKIP
jgi:hypothetical protein